FRFGQSGLVTKCPLDRSTANFVLQEISCRDELLPSSTMIMAYSDARNYFDFARDSAPSRMRNTTTTYRQRRLQTSDEMVIPSSASLLFLPTSSLELFQSKTQPEGAWTRTTAFFGRSSPRPRPVSRRTNPSRRRCTTQWELASKKL